MYTPEEELTFRDFTRPLVRRLPLILVITAVVFLVATLLWLRSPRRYLATASIMVKSPRPNSLDNVLTGSNAAGGGAQDALSADVEVQTQAALLQANALATRTINKLNLANTADFKPDAGDQAKLLETFHRNLTVKPVGGTSLIDVSFLDPDPKLAALVANTLVAELTQQGFESQRYSAENSTHALSGQLADLRKRSEDLQGQVAQMQRTSGIYSVGTSDPQGRPQAYSAILSQFERSAQTLSTADENRILKQGIAEAARSGNAEMLSSLAGNGVNSAGASNSLTSIQTMRAQEATVQGQLDQLRVKFGPGYPRVAELQANLAAVQNAIQSETQRIGARARTDSEVANRTYEDARRDYESQKLQADKLNDRAIQYVITRQEADETRTLYEDLLRRLKEAGILEALHHSTIEVIDPAMAPRNAAKPRTILYLGGGLLGGLFLGLVTAILLGLTSDAVEAGDELERLGLPFAGIMPLHEGKSELYSTRVRTLRSSMMRELGAKQGAVAVLTQVSSKGDSWPLPLALAQSFARSGRRTLVIQLETRVSGDSSDRSIPTLMQLLSEPSVRPASFQTAEPNLFMLPAGGEAEHVADLLAAPHLHGVLDTLRAEFDLILIETPPVSSSAESQILSASADLILLSADLHKTSRTAILRAAESLRAHGGGHLLLIAEGGSERALRDYYGFAAQNSRHA